VLQGKKPEDHRNNTTLWNLEKLQHYFCTIRKMTPETSEDANTILSKYYWMQRQSTHRNAARTTVRFLESLLRYYIILVIIKTNLKYFQSFDHILYIF